MSAADPGAWMEIARRDLTVAKLAADAEEPLVESALFHVQQCPEKALKAYLVARQLPFRKTHSIEELGRACAHIDRDFAPLTDRIVHLTGYATQFRYPGGEPVPPPGEVQEAIALAEEVLKFVDERLLPESKGGA